MKYVLIGCLVAAGFAQPLWADATDCIDQSAHFTEALFKNRPADPELMTQLLELQRQADALCQQEKLAESAAQINQAYSLLGLDVDSIGQPY